MFINNNNKTEKTNNKDLELSESNDKSDEQMI